MREAQRSVLSKPHRLIDSSQVAVEIVLRDLFERTREGYALDDKFAIEFFFPGMEKQRMLNFRPIRTFDERALQREIHLHMQSGSRNVQWDEEVFHLSGSSYDNFTGINPYSPR